MRKICTYLVLAFLLLGAYSCENKSKFLFVHEFENNRWKAFNNVEFSGTIKDRENQYQLKLTFELKEDFAPSEFSFGFTQNNDEGESIFNHYAIPVKNNEGELNGEFQTKDSTYAYTLVLNGATYFNSDSTYHFIFENTMNKFELEGVKRLTLDISSK